MKIKKEMKSDTPITRVQMVLMKENKHEFKDFVKLFTPIVDTIAHIDYLDHGIQDTEKAVVNFSRKTKKILLSTVVAENVYSSRWYSNTLLYRL